MWLRFTDVEIGTKTIQMRKDLAKGQSYETVVENTGYSGGNGIAAECGNRDSESEIIFGNSQFCRSYTYGIRAGYPAVSGSVSAGVFYEAEGISYSRPFCTRTDCGHCQQCAAGVSDNPVYCVRSASDEICGNASYNVSDLVADYSDGSGSRCGGYVLRAALEKGTNGCAEG